MLLRKGRSYDLLPESCPIFLCDFDPFGARAPLYTLEIACRECGDVALGHGFHGLVLNASVWSELPERGEGRGASRGMRFRTRALWSVGACSSWGKSPG